MTKKGGGEKRERANEFLKFVFYASFELNIPFHTRGDTFLMREMYKM